jgi:hypothetical protein
MTTDKTLTELLKEAGSRWVETDWTAPKNGCIDDIIERFDDCPESLLDFDHSNWVNMAEPYTHRLLKRWDDQTDGIRALFSDYCEAIGATSTLQALEGECDSFEDGDDMTAAIVNHAMTWGARMLADEVYPNR